MRESETAVAAEASCIALYEPLDNLLHIEFASGEADEGVRHLTLPMGQGILGEVAASGKAVLVEDAHRDPRFDSSVDRQTGFTTKSILATPIRRREELLGVLEVINKKGGPCFTEEDSLLLEVVANQAAVAIENAKLFERSAGPVGTAFRNRPHGCLYYPRFEAAHVGNSGLCRTLGQP